MRSYTAEQYRRLVEETRDPTLRHYMQTELAFIARVPHAPRRTFVDLGAGHGRLVPALAELGRDVLAIELNPDMYRGLVQVAEPLSNVTPVRGDILELERLLEGEAVRRPVFVIAQNSLGTIEGDRREVLCVVRSQMQRFDGELVLSLLRQQALGEWGLQMYARLHEMVGEVDLDATDTASGSFVSRTGYTSKWWSDAEIARLAEIGHVADELVEDEFHLLRLSAQR